MAYYVCKSCGRAIQTSHPPKYCYADRMDTLEQISDDDSTKMRLFNLGATRLNYFYERGYAIEFPGDQRWNPFNGEVVIPPEDGLKLSDFQDAIMQKCRERTFS